MKIQIAIIGSCATRDAFRSDMNPGYKDMFSCCFMQSKISLISLASTYQLDLSGIDVLADWEQKTYTREMNKNVMVELIDSKPDYIIIDLFADAYFGINEFGEGNYVTYNSWLPTSLLEKMKTGKHITVESDKEKYCSLLRYGISLFITTIREKLPHTKLLFNNIRSANEYINIPEGYYLTYDFSNIYNNFIVVTEVMKEFNLPEINVFNKYDVKGDFNHIWGFGVVHFEKKYYKEFYTELVDICLRDLIGK